MSEKTRVSTHNGRAGKKGAYSAKHNDRQFDTSTTDHIDPTLTHLNKNLRFGEDFGAVTNEEHELAFYQKHFGESLERKNAGYKVKGKPGQIKTMEQYYRAVKSCPEETLYTIGENADPELLWKIYLEHQKWKAERFPLCQTLDASLHVDEPDAMVHVHERSVWVGHDAKGMEVVGQAKALVEMNLLPPDVEKKYGQFNNAKQTFSRLCREHFIEVCRKHGLEVEVEPLPSDEVGLELQDYKAQKAKERVNELENQLKRYQDMEVEVNSVPDTAKRAKIRRGMLLVPKADHEAMLEATKAYRANKARFEALPEREKSVTKRENAVKQRESAADERDRQLDQRSQIIDQREKQTDVVTLRNELQTTQDKLKNLKNIRITEESVFGSPETLYTENKALKADKDALTATIGTLNESLKTAQGKTNELQGKANELQEKLQNAINTIETQKKTIFADGKKIDDLQWKFDDVCRERDAAVDEKNTAVKDLKKYKAEVEPVLQELEPVLKLREKFPKKWLEWIQKGKELLQRLVREQEQAR